MNAFRLLCTGIFLSALTHTSHADSKKTHFLPYRTQLMKSGWHPFEFKKRPFSEFPVTGEEASLMKMKIKEVESCSMDGGVLCNFWYVKNGACLMVTTRGERPKDMKIITQKKDECPSSGNE